MPRPGLSTLIRPAMLVLAMLAASLIGARPAQAAGCHVPERPVLGVRHSWDGEARLQAWEMMDLRDAAPPILTQLPCPGEVPDSPIVVEVSALAACMPTADFEPSLDSELTPLGDDAEASPPPPFHLDRPPKGE